MYLTSEIEEQSLTFIYDKLKLHLPVVFKNPFYFVSKEDFAARAGEIMSRELEAVFAMISFKGYKDGETQPMCDNPTAYLNYRIFLFQEYKAVRKDLDQTNSRQDFVKTIINIRDEFFYNQAIVKDANNYVIAQHKELVPLGDILENEETRYLQSVKGDSIEYNLLVEVI